MYTVYMHIALCGVKLLFRSLSDNLTLQIRITTKITKSPEIEYFFKIFFYLPIHVVVWVHYTMVFMMSESELYPHEFPDVE